MMLCTGVFGFAYFFVGVFMCSPVPAWWIRKHDIASKDYGSCISDDAVVGLTYAAGSLNSIADFTFGLIPFFIIKDLHMPKKSKRLVACILTVANIACVATIIRMPYVLDLYKTDDWLYATVDMVTWCTVEIGVGITAACFATLRPLLRIFFGLSASQWFPEQHPVSGRINTYVSNDMNPSGPSGESYTLKSAVPKLRPDHVDHYTEISSAGSRQSRGRARHRRDLTITERAMRSVFSSRNDDEHEDETLSTRGEVPDGAGHDRADGTRSPGLEIRKNFEFRYSIHSRKEDEMDDYNAPRPPPASWQSETAAEYARNMAARTRANSGQRSSEDGSLNLPMQTNGVDAFSLPLQTHGLDK